MEPFVTVHAGLPAIDRASMPARLRKILASSYGGAAADAAPVPLANAQTSAFRVSVVARSEEQALAARTSVVLPTPRHPFGFENVSWQSRQIMSGQPILSVDLRIGDIVCP